MINVSRQETKEQRRNIISTALKNINKKASSLKVTATRNTC
jgi:hypothetical protein